ncbi:MAG: DsbC family protein [Gammaproteobacteria bacterium]|nr:DsbC family protein [Gammaproteobacteria bacterium]
MRHLALPAFGLLLFAVASCAQSQDEATEALHLEGEAAAAIRAKLKAVRPDLPLVAVVPAALDGFYAVEFEDGTIFYATEDGGFLIAGDLYEVTDSRFVNRSEDVRARRRAETIAGLGTDEMIVFPANGNRRAVISVFTDIDCGFCRRLHLEVPELNRSGVEVRYLAFPRAGVGSGSYDKHVWAWCATDPLIAITRLKNGQSVEPRTCSNPVADHHALSQQLGVRGTPAIFLEDGRYLPGYMPAAELLKELGLD